MLNYLDLGKTLIEVQKLEDLEERLFEAREDHYFDYYLLKDSQKNILFYNSHDGKLEKLNQKFTRFNEILEFEDHVYSTIEVQGYQLMIGFNRSRARYVQLALEYNYHLLFREVVLVILGFLFITTYFFRDIKSIIKGITNPKARDFSKAKTRSMESQILTQSLIGYEKRHSKLHEEVDTLKNQVLPSLRSELESGKIPPYQFDCTLVRVDINNFSEMFSNYPVETVMEVVNQFLALSARIVHRYEGFVHEIIGDEILFYFKENSSLDSRELALSSIRDIFSASEGLNIKTKSEHGFSFHVKSSLAQGMLRFGRQVLGYNLSGTPLIKTVRIISEIFEQEKNEVLFCSEIASLNSKLFQTRFDKTANLKGIEENSALYKVIHTLGVEDVLKNLNANSVSSLTYFRSDKDLQTIFEYLGQNVQTLTKTELLGASRALSTFFSEETSLETEYKYLDLLVKIEKLCDKDNENFKVLASYVTLGRHILPENSYSPGLATVLSGLLSNENARVVANTVDLVTHLEGDDEMEGLIKLDQARNNRVKANLIIQDGYSRLDKKLISNLKEMLTSSDPLQQASALYAYGELMKHHSEKDLVYLSSNIEFCNLMKLVKPLVKSSNEMIANQARSAIKKSQSIENAA